MDHKIRVLQFTIAASKGGRTQYILNLWKHIDHSRFHFDFVTFSEQLDFENELIENGCKVFHIRNYPEKNREGFISEFREILRNEYDVIEIHTSYWKDTIVEELAKASGIKKILVHGHSTGITQITACNREEEQDRIFQHQKVKRRLNDEMASEFIACSSACADWLFRPQISEKKITILYNTIDTGRFQYNPEKRMQARSLLKINNEFVIGFVGRVEPAKNLKFLINVYSEIKKCDKETILLIVGDGSENREIRAYANEKVVDGSVIFTGTRKDTEVLYQAMDCFMLPSLFEGFPLVVLEAFCCGLGCAVSANISEDICINDDIVRLSIADIEPWVEFALESRQKKDRVDNGRLLVEKGFDTKTQMKKIQDIYCE